jgi:hypothetical protein
LHAPFREILSCSPFRHCRYGAHIPIRIGAQKYLVAFYASFGFETDGDEYDEDGIPHSCVNRVSSLFYLRCLSFMYQCVRCAHPLLTMLLLCNKPFVNAVHMIRPGVDSKIGLVPHSDANSPSAEASDASVNHAKSRRRRHRGNRSQKHATAAAAALVATSALDAAAAAAAVAAPVAAVPAAGSAAAAAVVAASRGGRDRGENATASSAPAQTLDELWAATETAVCARVRSQTDRVDFAARLSALATALSCACFSIFVFYVNLIEIIGS